MLEHIMSCDDTHFFPPFKKKFNVYLFLRETETETVQVVEGAERERETQDSKQAPGSELSAQSPTRGSNPRTATP